MKVKTFVLDTNVLLHDPNSIESFEDNCILIPMAVIEELDRFKTRVDDLGRNARQVIRRLDSLRTKGKISEGVPLDNGGILKIIKGSGKLEGIDLNLDLPDNKIIRVAYSIFAKGDDVIFVSKDINARLKADALGIESVDYEKSKVFFDELYSGYQSLSVTSKLIERFYDEKFISLDELKGEFYPNQFLLLEDEVNVKHTALARVSGQDGIIPLVAKFDSAWHVKPRSREQRMALELLLDDTIKLVTLVGQAGTGKTLLAIAAALEQTIDLNKFDKILVSRPIMPMGKDIGYLPGDKNEKLENWMGPIFDNLRFLLRGKNGDPDSSQKKMQDLLSNHVIELEALTYIRGRSIARQFVIVDEAQNLTPHEIKTIISRAGEGTKMVLTGDPYQIDNPYLDSSSNGLIYAVERLKNEKIHGHITLKKSERSSLAAAAASLL
ncbi:MAG: phosphate starvation-inducible protein PhoH [Planctomycetota bacterium]|nr:MAG: phosphate starvation-inducible protein PhoH [Planctomycetota bacterium]